MMQFTRSLEELKGQMAIQKQDMELQYKKWERMMDAEEKEAELTTDLIIAEKKAQVDLIEGVRNGENRL
jgi:hypothetical protein